MLKQLLMVVGIGALGLSAALADSVEVAGFTSGTFSQINSHPDLSFANIPANSGFDVTTNAAGNYSGVNLGSFTLTDCVGAVCSNTDSGTFTLTVHFTLPQVISGGQGQSFIANVTGTIQNRIRTGDAGQAFIDFNNNPVTLTYSNSGGSGSFAFAVQDVNLSFTGAGNSDTESILGNITNATFTPVSTPEPWSIALTLTLCIGVVIGYRKKLFA